MNSTKNLLLVTIIAATMVMGTSVIPMQSYADRDNNDDHKKTKDFKSSISASYDSSKKSSSQHQDQDNFCYRGDDCEQANQGQQIVGKDNAASGFNDQSKNLALASSLTGAGAGNGTGTGNGTTPIPNCRECFTASLTAAEIAAFETLQTVQSFCDRAESGGQLSASGIIIQLSTLNIDINHIIKLLDCFRSLGFNLEG